jgi:uncharacterized protein YkwD
MKTSAICSLMVTLLVFSLTYSQAGCSRSLPPDPFVETRMKPSSHDEEKARQLFRLAQRENGCLKWDECLAGKAFKRAKELVKEDTFAHMDPKTGKNPAWDMVKECHSFRYAGENLAKGDVSAEALHRALMQSPTHRANLISSKYRSLGVGCYGQVCVQLFAGF